MLQVTAIQLQGMPTNHGSDGHCHASSTAAQLVACGAESCCAWLEALSWGRAVSGNPCHVLKPQGVQGEVTTMTSEVDRPPPSSSFLQDGDRRVTL